MPLRTAREAFLVHPDKAQFATLADNKAFDAAAEYALLAYIEELPNTDSDPNGAWTQHAKVMGARRVLEILRVLHIPVEPPPRFKPPTLKPPS